tara:strand:+ start:55 stop:2271 length:2217 start_codon:yes stop_codon:yes gene_type:complete
MRTKITKIKQYVGLIGLFLWLGSLVASSAVVQVGTLVDPDNVIVNNVTPPLFQEVASIPIVGDRTYVRDVDIFTGTSGLLVSPDGTPVDPAVTLELLSTTVDDGVNNNSITAQDDWNLVTVAGRRSFSDDPEDQNGRPAWQTGNFGGKATFTSTNATGPDFILFENAANDDLTVQAVFPDGTTGQWTGLIIGDEQQAALWSDTGLVTPDTAIGAGQGKFGVGWRVEHLLDADGNALPQDTEIWALRFNDPTSSPDTGLDPCLLVAVIIGETPTAEWEQVVDLDSGTDLPSGFTVLQEEGNFATSPTTTVVADPFGSGSNALAINPGVASTESSLNQTIEFAIPAALQVTDPVTESKPVTFYFQVARPTVGGVPAEADITWGMADSSARSEVGAPLGYGTYSVLGRIETNGIIDIRDAGSYIDLAETAIDTQTWYEFWFVVDHYTNTFSQYVRGGSGFPTQTLVYEDAKYRNETLNNLDTMLFITSAGTVAKVKGKDDTYLREFHIAQGVNLTSPGAPIVDNTARAEATDVGSTTIATTGTLPAEAVVGNLVFINIGPEGTELGKIASINGSILTLEDGSAVAVPAGSQLFFVEDDEFPIEDAGNVLNISTRGLVGSGDNVMIGGFIIVDGPQTVFVAARASELAAAGVPNLLPDPVLTISPQGDPTPTAVVDNWEDDAEMAQIITDVWGGSPPLDIGSTSAGIVITLQAGAWTGTISAADGTSDGGLAIFEVFEVNEQ